VPKAFNFAVTPFDALDAAQRQRVRDAVDIDYVPEGRVMLQPGEAPSHLLVLIKGHVQQWDGEELLATCGPGECFDGRALVAGRCGSRFVAAEEVLAYRLPRETVMALIADNDTFGALLFADLSHKLSALTAAQDQHELQNLTLSRVDQAALRPALVVDAATDIVSVARLLQAHKAKCVLVAGLGVGPGSAAAAASVASTAVAPGASGVPGVSGVSGVTGEPGALGMPAGDALQDLGIFTATGLQRAILSGRELARLPVGELASRPLVTVRGSDVLVDAQATMIRHRVQRVVVLADGAAPGATTARAQDGPGAGTGAGAAAAAAADPAAIPVGPGALPPLLARPAIAGILEQLDLLSFLSNHSVLITRQILEAASLDDLAVAAQQIERVIGLLHRGGTRVAHIARLVQELNAALMQRTWALLAPPALQQVSCLFVMGSEGRGEQLLRTDQDNGLVLHDDWREASGADEAGLAAACEAFSQALERFGWPPCPGGIMVRNADWRMSVSAWSARARGWLLEPSADALMALAIFVDAQPVAGDARLLATVREAVATLAADSDVRVARFAAAALQFDAADTSTGSAWWQRLFTLDGGAQDTLDLKKAGIFPLVHGVRALALAQRIEATGTVARLDALVAAGALGAAMATDLRDSLHFFMGLKLKTGLAARQQGRPAGSGLHWDRLSSLDRDLLKDTLGVVRQFKGLLRQRFRLDTL
jgi:CBS domain-containing protein